MFMIGFSLIGSLFIKSLECISLLVFLEIKMASDFLALNFTSQRSAHWCMRSKSEFIHLAASAGLSTIRYKLVSSANNRKDEFVSTTISFI